MTAPATPTPPRDPLEVLLVEHEQAERLFAEQLRRQLSDYLRRMPRELKPVFNAEYQRRHGHGAPDADAQGDE